MFYSIVMTAPSSPKAADPASAEAKIVRRWEGVLGRLKARPFRALLIAVVCLATIGLASYVVGTQIWGLYHWRKAERALERLDLDAARGHLQSCVNIWPTSAATHFQLARTCRRLGDLDAARTHLEKADELHWVRELIDLEYVLMQAQTGAVARVESTLLSYLEEGHSEARLILEALVRGYVQVNVFGEAFRWATIWQEQYPDDWQAYYWRGEALARGSMQNLAPEAAANFQRALELKPDLRNARLRLAEAQVRTGQFAEALEHLNVYREEDPDHPTAVTASARCLRSSGRSEEARRLMDDWLSRNPGNGLAFMVRGQLEMDQDRPEQALKWLLRPETQALFNMELNETLARVYRRLGNLAEADRYDEKNLQLDKDFKRMEMLTKESFINPKDVSPRWEAGTILLRHGQHQEAARWLLSALQEDPNHKPTHQALAELYQRIGERRRAEEHRRKAEEGP
jgi:tetratricopeptide (TPR) repeat protein